MEHLQRNHELLMIRMIIIGEIKMIVVGMKIAVIGMKIAVVEMKLIY